MILRILTSIILIPLIIGALFYLPLAHFTILVFVIITIGFWEWGKFVEVKNRVHAMIPAILICAITCYWLVTHPRINDELIGEHYILVIIGSLWWLVASFMTIAFPRFSSVWKNNKPLRYVFGILTLIPFAWSIVILRATNIATDFYYGGQLVLYVALLVWITDSGAYFVGKSIGKHKMSPNVSPNKTIEGLIGGVLLAVASGFFLATCLDLRFDNSFVMIVTTILTVMFSVFGDLVESMFKRVANIKDSGKIIVGHGGILDRIDSLTAAFPIFTFCYYMLQ